MADYKGWVEPISGYTVDITSLLQEFNENFASLMVDVIGANSVLVQKKFHLMLNHKYDDKVEGDKVLNTITIAEKIKTILDYDSINYRIVMPNTCYNWHIDTGKNCIHIPLQTNEGCLFVYDTKSFKMRADGRLYLVNNERPHTFVNSGKTPRLHLTFEKLNLN